MASVRPDVVSACGPAPRAKALRDRAPAGRDVLPSLVAHDLKSPLAAISMNLDFALSELKDPEQGAVRAALDDCKKANVRAVRIVSDMADALRLQSGDLRPSIEDVAVSKVVESVVARAAVEASARGVRIVWASSGDRVRADAELLETALARLVERAVRHTTGTCLVDHRAGTITVRAETPSAEAEAGAQALALVFADTAVRAQGGRFWIDAGPGSLVYGVELPKS